MSRQHVAGAAIAVILGATGIAAYTTTHHASANYTPPKGAYNATVTQATIFSTICTIGWTATIRPSTSYTNALKAKQMKARHLPGIAASYEEDHLVALELGGHPTAESNLWPEARNGKHATASKKDAAENRLRKAVCSGTITLGQARKQITNPKEWTP